MSFRKRYFFFDIDGTLLPSSEDPVIPPSAREGIDELRQRGYFCCLATGRSEYMSRDLCRELGFDNLVSDGGYGITLEGNKAAGIRQVMDYYGAPYEDVVVFGDQRNDLSMFYPEEWTCIAMGNACDEVKARATYVTKDVRDDGLAHALRHFGWID